MIKILYCSLKYDYANPNNGLSYEYYNLEAGLKDFVKDNDSIDLKIYHIDDERIKSNREQADQELKELINKWNPDILFHTSFDDNWDLDHTLLTDCKSNGMKVLLWNCDASWRFHDFILPRKNVYSHFITTHSMTVPLFEQNDMKVIRSQWAVSPLLELPKDRSYLYKTSFVGQNHSIRPQIIKYLKDNSINVELFGRYWDGFDNWHKYISFEEMSEVFGRSKINLNFAIAFNPQTMPQLKGRHWEIPGCKGFQISTPADDLERYFEIGKEIVVVNSLEEMAEKIHYYLSHDDEREAIALAGYERSARDHSWKQRFEHILSEI